MTAARLQCAAPHPDRPGQTCNSLLAFGNGFTTLGTADHAPEHSFANKGTVWLRCHRDNCGAWTEFRIPKHSLVTA